MENKVIYHTPRLSYDEKIDYSVRFTEAYKKYSNSHRAIREAMCMKVQFPESLCGIMENDLVVGRFDVLPVQVSVQVTRGQSRTGYVCIFEHFDEMIENEDITEENIPVARDLMSYWKNEDSVEKFYMAVAPEDEKYIHHRTYSHGYGVGFPSFRQAGVYIDYDKLLRLGVKGLTEQAGQYKKSAAAKGRDPDLYEGVILALQTVTDSCKWYAAEARKAMGGASSERKAQLERLAAAMDKISWDAPETFYEALNLSYLYSVLICTREYGRMDEYMGDFYAKDLEAGVITQEEAVQMLESLWRVIVARNETFDDRIIIGGLGRRNPENADKLALIAIEASRRVKDVVPQLTLRCYKGMNPALYQKALDAISEGATYPMLYNDDINVPAVQSAFHVPYEYATGYVPLGCGEYTINHRHMSSPNGAFNLLNCLDITFRNGYSPYDDSLQGLQQGYIKDFKTFDELWQAYCGNVDNMNNILAKWCMIQYDVVAKDCAFPLVMPLYDDIMDTGKGLIDGIKSLGRLDASNESYGLINTADSLTAIKRLVYDQKLISAEELMAALEANFEGYEKVRAALLACPKYGNDNPEADEMAVKVHEQFCYSNIRAGEKAGLNAFLVVNINNSSNTTWGRETWASPDGRLRGTHMANANNPYPGNDKNGVTALLHSLTKLRPDIHAGYVQNMKFSKELFVDMRPIAEATLETYWDNGGTQAMITVIGREDLQAAMLHPENYPNLIVRVGGFSARFVELEKDIQMEILSRTCY